MEMIVGQFTSRASVKMWEVVPALRGSYFIEFLINCTLREFPERLAYNNWFSIQLNKIFLIFNIGVAVGQIIAITCIVTYYASLIALTLSYLFKSFAYELPWATCSSTWTEKCINSSSLVRAGNASINASSSSELYFQ